jgi:hypothetical protein
MSKATATKIETKERPILFSGEMVRAILDGRKTQTRRIVKDENLPTVYHGAKIVVPQWYAEKNCPYGQPGDRLWVRETWAYTDQSLNVEPGYVYRATDPDWETMEGWKWKPSIFMPRAASRITLEVTDVRIERLHDIGIIDLLAEGMQPTWNGESSPGVKCEGEFEQFAELWSKINGEDSWDANPWVWVVSFKRID